MIGGAERDGVLRWGYAVLALVLLSGVTARLVREAAQAVRAGSRYRFVPEILRWSPPPPWPEAAWALRRAASRFRGRPLGDGRVWEEFERALERLPWVAEAVCVPDAGGRIRVELRYRRPVLRLRDGRTVTAGGQLLPPVSGREALPELVPVGGELTWAALRAAAREVSRLEAAPAGRTLRERLRRVLVYTRRRWFGPEHWLAFDVARERGGTVRLLWGRPTHAPRPADLTLERRLAGWRRLKEAPGALERAGLAQVAFWPPSYTPASRRASRVVAARP